MQNYPHRRSVSHSAFPCHRIRVAEIIFFWNTHDAPNPRVGLQPAQHHLCSRIKSFRCLPLGLDIAQHQEQVFREIGLTPVTVLSPAGWRIGSLGMLLLQLIKSSRSLCRDSKYTCCSTAYWKFSIIESHLKWHIWLTGDVYKQN